MKNEVEQIALQNDMSIEFVTWFFNEKKVGCGNVWFMMMAAMWEGWKGRSIEMDKLATENVALKSAVTQQIELRSEIKKAGRPPHADFWVQSICEAEDRVSKALNGTPATDRIVAGITADGVESGIKTIMTMLNHQAPGVSDAINVLRVHSSELREGADK
ncbi:hypothetical protein [Klebsiella pneumoniae]|uniref:hypothetical protein n=1 Tax=Klebsiella pneumoniae TaxID=573 RepID=UPI003F680438